MRPLTVQRWGQEQRGLLPDPTLGLLLSACEVQSALGMCSHSAHLHLESCLPDGRTNNQLPGPCHLLPFPWPRGPRSAGLQ